MYTFVLDRDFQKFQIEKYYIKDYWSPLEYTLEFYHAQFAHCKVIVTISWKFSCKNISYISVACWSLLFYQSNAFFMGCCPTFDVFWHFSPWKIVRIVITASKHGKTFGIFEMIWSWILQNLLHNVLDFRNMLAMKIMSFLREFCVDTWGSRHSRMWSASGWNFLDIHMKVNKHSKPKTTRVRNF